MNFKYVLIYLLTLRSVTASMSSTGPGNCQLNPILDFQVARTSRLTGYTLSTHVSGNKAVSGEIAPRNTEFWLNFGYSWVCYPNDEDCSTKVAPSIVYAKDTFPQLALNSTAIVFDYGPLTQVIYIDFQGALRYLTPPQQATVNNEPYGLWTVTKSTKTGKQILNFAGMPRQDAPAPFYLCPRNTGPILSPPQYPIYYQLYVGVNGFFRNLNATGCIEIEVHVTPSNIGAYLFV